MMKKTLSVLLAACLVCFCLIPAFAAGADETGDPTDLGVIRVKLNSNVGGYTDSEVDKLIEIKSGHVVCEKGVYFYDYAGTTILDDKIVAGRRYTADYILTAAPGYEMPASVDDLQVEIETEKGVTVIQTVVTTGKYRLENGEFETRHSLKIFVKVAVDGNVFQRLIGSIVDIVLKIRAWSLY